VRLHQLEVVVCALLVPAALTLAFILSRRELLVFKKFAIIPT